MRDKHQRAASSEIPQADIPTIFYAYTTHAPFERCISCDHYLLENTTEYLIEKAFRQYPDYEAKDVIFEYAMCFECAEMMRKELSKESLANIQQYFNDRVDFYGHHQEMMYEHALDAQAWLSRCIVTGEPQATLEEYQIYGHCRGNQMVFSYMPYLIGGKAMEALSTLISEKTRGEIDRFVDEHFGIPPEWKEPIKNRPIVLV